MNASSRYFQRQELVKQARQSGIKPTARKFGCSATTIRKWLRRASLEEMSRRPHRSPNQTPPEVEAKVVSLRKTTGFGARRLKFEFPEIACGVGAIQRIIRANDLTLPRRKRHHRRKSLAKIKAAWLLFGQLCMDTKYLTDLPHYWPQMTHLKLPRFQYTIREVVSGCTFVGYADAVSKTYACLLAEKVCQHLRACGVEMSSVMWQTDNGSEFEKGFPESVQIYGCKHRYIPVKRYTWQGDVETVHSTEETEFFGKENFSSASDFWSKLRTYWLYYNLARPNSNKGWKSPAQIIQQKNPNLSKQLPLLYPLDLRILLAQRLNHHSGVHDLPCLPSRYICTMRTMDNGFDGR